METRDAFRDFRPHVGEDEVDSGFDAEFIDFAESNPRLNTTWFVTCS